MTDQALMRTLKNIFFFKLIEGLRSFAWESKIGVLHLVCQMLYHRTRTGPIMCVRVCVCGRNRQMHMKELYEN